MHAMIGDTQFSEKSMSERSDPVPRLRERHGNWLSASTEIASHYTVSWLPWTGAMQGNGYYSTVPQVQLGMAEVPSLGNIISEFVPVPSAQMVIRRYRPLNEKYIRSFFEQGLFCRHVPTFDDDNEGFLKNPPENDVLRGVLTDASADNRKRDDSEIASNDKLTESLYEFHQDVRHKHFANCWRLGTDEPHDIWREYTDDDELVDGFAFETTVGQFIRALPTEPSDPDWEEEMSLHGLHETAPRNLHVGATWSDIRIGAVRYQERQQDDVVQPAAYQAAINFFKESKFDKETEFRLVINPFDSARRLVTETDGTLRGRRPDVEDESRFFPMATTEMVNRIVLAPHAGADQRDQIQTVLDDVGIRYGPTEADDLEIIASAAGDTQRSDTHPYAAELYGTDNYDESTDYLEGQQEAFLQETDWDQWSTVDLVEINMDRAGTITEGYRYPTDNPAVEMRDYGHDEFQRVAVTRVHREGEDADEYTYEKWTNERLKAFLDAQQTEEDI